MARTLVQVQRQIAELKAVEDKLRQAEIAGVVARIREAIGVYGITSQDLFGTNAAKSKGRPKAQTRSGAAKYADGTGNTWSGRGRRPGWVVDALGSGKTLEDFAASQEGSVSASQPAAPKRKGKSAGKKPSVPPKYSDGTNAWSGRGSQPVWLKAALADGKNLEDFAV